MAASWASIAARALSSGAGTTSTCGTAVYRVNVRACVVCVGGGGEPERVVEAGGCQRAEIGLLQRCNVKTVCGAPFWGFSRIAAHAQRRRRTGGAVAGADTALLLLPLAAGEMHLMAGRWAAAATGAAARGIRAWRIAATAPRGAPPPACRRSVSPIRRVICIRAITQTDGRGANGRPQRAAGGDLALWGRLLARGGSCSLLRRIQ